MTTATADMTNQSPRSLLGDDADDLLNYQAKGFAASDLYLPGPTFVDDVVSDGLYLLNLQLPAFHSDAAPCRPVVYALNLEC